MAKIAFIGLGNMGGGMAANLVKAGHGVVAFDLSQDALAKARDNGCTPVDEQFDAVDLRDVEHQRVDDRKDGQHFHASTAGVVVADFRTPVDIGPAAGCQVKRQQPRVGWDRRRQSALGAPDQLFDNFPTGFGPSAIP